MSTLSEIAMNHARMVKRLAQESLEQEARQPLVVGGFEVSTLDTPEHMPLHFIMDTQDRNIDLTAVAV
ncbi:hypothetical protein N5D52_14445 [Pseudomonas sp. GD03860]|uniref:hypothetical protein n=1 Tax=Pseudomonas TaxID=286 RepID=UPI002363C117|nr:MULTISPECIES: hypothetical protein [Pseudomonas]MDD2056659.1 hypothetical protein [Pseudomonas putida]MDH0638147.1 hypothetical protein [Pseudomonas sp. GD03860]